MTKKYIKPSKGMKATFRTIRNLRDYNDDERGFPPPIVDDTDYEDINVLVKRFMRGEMPKVGMPVHYDGNGSAEQMIADANPFNADGVDLADVGPVKDAIKARKRAKAKPKEEKATPPGEVEEKPKEPSPKQPAGPAAELPKA